MSGEHWLALLLITNGAAFIGGVVWCAAVARDFKIH